MKLYKLYRYLFSNKVLQVLFLIFGVFWLLSFHHRYIEADECILGEYSYSFLTEGFVRVKSIPAIEDWDVRMFPHHRFFTWFGAGVIAVFGWSITWLKIAMLPWYLLFFLFLHQYFRLKDLSTRYFVLASLLIFTTPIILLKSFSFRPDIILMTEAMGLLYFLIRYRQNQKVKDLIIAGGIAGLGFLTHLNGAAFCIAGFVFLLIKREYQGLLFFTVSGAIIGGIYFIELLPDNNFERFIYQLQHWPTINHGENFVGGDTWSLIKGRMIKLLSEHKRFFWGNRVMGFSVLFFVTLLLNFKTLKARHTDTLVFLLLLVLSLNIFGSHIAERYLLFYYGPMTILTSVGILNLMQKNSWKQMLLGLAFAFHIALGAAMLVEIEKRSVDYPVVNKDILANIADADARILVPYEMIYNEFPNRDLYVFKTYEYLGEGLPGGKMTQSQLFEKAYDLGMDYIVINEKLANDKGRWFYDWVIGSNPYFDEYHKDDQSLILKRISKKL